MATKKPMRLLLNLILNKLSTSVFVYIIHLRAGLQSKIYNTYSTEDKLSLLAVEVLTHLLDTSDLK